MANATQKATLGDASLSPNLIKPEAASPLSSASQPSPNAQRPGVMARLHALFPSPSGTTDSQSPYTAQPSEAMSQRKKQRNFIKVRILTWNMHDSIPKGDLSELLGEVIANDPSFLPPESQPTLTQLSNDPNPPYHLIVVAGQECPTVSGLPRGLGAPGFQLKEKERDRSQRVKEKEKEKEPLKQSTEVSERSRSQEPEKEEKYEDSDRRSIHRFHLHRDRSQHRISREDLPSANSHDSSHHQAYGWSAMLEEWYTHSGHTAPQTSISGTRFSEDPAPPKPTLLDVKIGDKPSEDVILSPKARSTGDLTLRMNAKTNAKGPYELLVKERMMGLYLAVFVNRDVRGLVRGVSKSAVTAGLIGGRVGNKGGVGISVNIDGTTFLFINAHLAAHEGKIHHRIANLTKIKNELDVDDFLDSDDPRAMAEDVTDRFDHTFLCGDLNFRLDITRLHADWLISRQEFAQAFAFDQLHRAMESGEAFQGFHEAPINFPPTFKYDVLRTIKRGKSQMSRSSSRRTQKPPPIDLIPHAKLLSEIEEQEREAKEAVDHEHEVIVVDDDDDEDGDGDGEGGNEAASLASTIWTSVGSKYTVEVEDADRDREEQDEEDESFPTTTTPSTRASASASTTNLVHKLWTATAANKAKNKWVSLISTSSAPGTPRGHRWKFKSKRHDGHSHSVSGSGELSVPPTPITSVPDFRTTPSTPADESRESEKGLRPDSSDNKYLKPHHISLSSVDLSKAAGRLSPTKLLRRSEERHSTNSEENEDDDKGVYDSSHKQRVPSWCDRILWKSSVVQSESDEEEDVPPPLPPRTRMGQILQAFRPLHMRTRHDSHASGSTVSVDVAQTPTSPCSSDDGHHDLNPTIPSVRLLPHSPPRPSLTRSSESLPLSDHPAVFRSQTQFPGDSRTWQNRKTTLPVSQKPVLPALNLPRLHDSISPELLSPSPDIAPSVPPKDNSPPTSNRWLNFNFLPFLSRDVPSSATTSSPPPSVYLPPPPPRKGDVVCLSYGTLDDKGMRRLEGRSDHRPVIGTYAVYI